MIKDDDLDAAFIRYDFAEFVSWTTRLLYETKTQFVSEIAYLCPTVTAFRSWGLLMRPLSILRQQIDNILTCQDVVDLLYNKLYNKFTINRTTGFWA